MPGMISRRAVVNLVMCLLCAAAAARAGAQPASRPPNIVLIMADDLGPGELGCYGQKTIRTPNIDRLATQGMRFTSAYAPAALCSPTRCSLLTGLHQGHAPIRNNVELDPEGQMPLPEGTVLFPELLKQAGYATACVGKWGLGPVGSSGDPIKHGFDLFYGHNCQRAAHNQYTAFVWRNEERVMLQGNAPHNLRGAQYVPDLMADEAVGWMRGHKDSPFFLYFATPLPHASLQAPEEAVKRYRGVVEEGKPYADKPGGFYEPCAEPRATYAAMITRIDDHVGRILAEIDALGLADNTIVLFTSDNGTAVNGGADAAYFDSTEGRRGLKHDLYEGGIRMPMLIRWPGHVKAGSTCDTPIVHYDLMPTFLALAGVPVPKRADGVSLLPLLTGTGSIPKERPLYWEYAAKGGQKAVRRGKWKAVWVGLKKNPDVAGELYDLGADPGEKTNLAGRHREILQSLTQFRDESHTPASVKGWNF
jgi:arylsulfatase A-like enzyme